MPDIYEYISGFIYMGKVIRISEEQAKKLFGGDNFLEYLKEDNDRRGYSDAIGFNQSTRDDVPRGRAYKKMRSFGASTIGHKSGDEITTPKTGDDFINTVVKLMYKINGGPVNIIDALEIINKLKGQDISQAMTDAGVDYAGEIKQFLDTLDIATIFSNYLIIDQPDYVYYRLQHLTPQEIATIKETYGKDFKTWGLKCDGCGLQEWKTNVFVNTGDDAHINLEYMGSQGKSTDGKSLGEMKTYRIPFQIHHMNENPSDNSPLNLSCLCPNCHSLTGSYGVNKTAKNGQITNDDLFRLRELEEKTKPIDTDAIAEEIKERLKMGHFQDKHVAALVGDKSMVGANITEEELDSTVNTIIDNVSRVVEKEGEFSTSEPSKEVEVGNIAGRTFFARYYKSKSGRMYVSFYNDANVSQQKEQGNAFNTPDIECTNIKEPRVKNYIASFLREYILRSLVSSEKGVSRSGRWDNQNADLTSTFKEKDPEEFRKDFMRKMNFDPMTGSETEEPEKREN